MRGINHVDILNLLSQVKQILCNLQRVLCTLTKSDFTILLNKNRRKRKVSLISNGNRTEWSPIQSVIIRVITKSDDRAAGVQFVYHEYDYRLDWTTRSPDIN